MKNSVHFLFAIMAILVMFKIVDLDRVGSNRNVTAIMDTKTYFKEKKLKRAAGYAKLDQPEMYGIIQQQLRTAIDEEFPSYDDNYLVQEINKAKKNAGQSHARNELDFISRGPGNVAGRTRALLVDPRDATHATWIAGSASGGIWKTADMGQTWRNVSEDLTSLSTNTLAMSASNPDIIYAGTGEHFVTDTDGNGLWKSEDSGESWTQMASPAKYEGFKNISRIAVDPNNADVVVVSTSNGSWVQIADYAIWKTIDGGENFTRVYTSDLGRIDDIDANPENFSTLYAAIQGYGVIKSTDAGESWFEPSASINGVARVEIDVSPVDTARVWASAEGGSSSSGSTIYLSVDAGVTWAPLIDADADIDYLGGQGFYDNIITAHPYSEDEAYVGGVNVFKVSVVGQGEEFYSFKVSQLGTRQFMNFVNGTDFSDEALIPESDLKSVEIRFGQGIQKAHRFTTDMQGAGVPFGSYSYNDYVEVPFTVWDTENNVQLMASFRDQQEDTAWNLIGENTDGDPGSQSREYLFIHDIPYSQQQSAEITQTGGVEARLMYFIWPHLTVGAEFNPDSLPFSTLAIDKFTGIGLESAAAVVSDAYGQFNNNNNFSNENFVNQEGLHPDQHNIIIVTDDDESETFRFISTNDGGVYITDPSVDPGTSNGDFNYAGFMYNTSQFYGADKAPGENRYIGGMQDNSTFFTPAGVDADSSARYDFAIGGDGFESIWNNSNPFQLIAGSQFNNFARSLDGGETWVSATNGISGSGPFISRLANSKRYPNRLFSVTSEGVVRSEDFGGSWELIAIDEMWSYNNSADIEVSHADSSVIWAGGFLNQDSRIFLSVDNGDNFRAVQNYDGEELGFVSGMGTHASDKATAYLLFSFSGKPKVIKTVDFGENWEDISGFEGNNGVSNRGFPDVAIQALLVFPNNTDRIWVGSEIGIIESLNGGDSWNLLDCNMPPVNVHDFKIQDDQVVIATYGRGIWSVKVDGIEQNFILQPSIIDASQSISGDISLDYYLPSNYDSTHIILDGEIAATIGANEKGSFEEILLNLGLEGDVVFEIESFYNSNSYFSLPFTVNLFVPGEVVIQYNNDFDEQEREDEFIGFGFEFALEDGFESFAIHSDHPHVNAVDYTYMLKSPYLLTEESSNQIQFKEVALIEPGEDGSVFGDDEFWDYVIVEGSKDGIEWTPLAPGYDASAHAAWLSAYNSDEEGNSNLFELRKIDINETFTSGDTILIRFRLSADAFVNGWGWAIDDLEIGDVSSGLFEVNFTNKASIFPNPVSSFLEIKSEVDLAKATVSIFNLEGRLIQRSVGKSSVDVSSFIKGSYFLTVSGDGINETHKFLKI